MPVEPVSKEIVDTYVSSVPFLMRRISSDLIQSLDTMAIGFLIAIILSLMMLSLLKRTLTVGVTVWVCIVGSILAFAFLAWSCYTEYNRV
jgi:hypothetical protein